MLAQPLLTENISEEVEEEKIVCLEVNLDSFGLKIYTLFKCFYFYSSLISISLLLEEVNSIKVFNLLRRSLDKLQYFHQSCLLSPMHRT